MLWTLYLKNNWISFLTIILNRFIKIKFEVCYLYIYLCIHQKDYPNLVNYLFIYLCTHQKDYSNLVKINIWFPVTNLFPLPISLAIYS